MRDKVIAKLDQVECVFEINIMEVWILACARMTFSTVLP